MFAIVEKLICKIFIIINIIFKLIFLTFILKIFYLKAMNVSKFTHLKTLSTLENPAFLSMAMFSF